jgi:MFS superfamily sulfate permease-like transporter
MFMVAASRSLEKCANSSCHAAREIAILIGTVIAVLWTHNLAIGVAVGMALSLLI